MTEEAAERYVAAAHERFLAYEAYDADLATEAFHRSEAELKRLIQAGEARRVLQSLLGHPSPGVRLFAATHSLGFAPDEAERVLEDLALMQGPTGLDARFTLDLWRDGAYEPVEI